MVGIILTLTVVGAIVGIPYIIWTYLVIKNKKDSKPYKTIIGSLLNDNDVSRAMKVYLNSKVVKNHSIFSYFNSLDELSKHEKKSQNSLSFLESKIIIPLSSFS